MFSPSILNLIGGLDQLTTKTVLLKACMSAPIWIAWSRMVGGWMPSLSQYGFLTCFLVVVEKSQKLGTDEG
ncbi:hypothetical protein ASPCAL07424 [Aspergillus calidoustus]|uniref:Uncharacterized protein n=1 Tax=Aspergillus calidoustus TaxID=454130 RepID=A0A0U5G6U6_ASPCI|nr:hypothetical protein ASPCAL07424 [Aspergillus calidoustus]